jgi:hypothetical protein
MAKDAKMMGHSVSTQQSVYVKKEWSYLGTSASL